ncbi:MULTISPECIES: diaminopimelate epimerase [Aneurinibacillus]|uniref:Diaminopimelate epimerase n=1 Tax=Aneurinibacillus thermoaerophilus TaxID=143495 RepID=A0A1G7WA99_ANETH|nr:MULTISPECIES: diaminopimelate epimerase [Aneurinibacillus]AMA72603.1 diaminopimelate epimerase [Aneurinibacillus sp. XH2]MED0674687.1 diaminopimelate epimerase [Aneurinibacillus thermoaerophilus]MED0680170.1 diaminopimelate epimerase [Aneurinibacillus thermoaerophilus]MED0736881.1 diaminopimelate epimerase [Aneurinibacillus thermoaerophilus]MED0756722.1 diaminopimelate epimerase [Aneurinibacillus thermoaerophilus]
MNFTKMNGLGNDFIIVAHFETLPENASDMARVMCDRHFGIGADGLVFVLPSDKADVCMRIINADGSEAEQCGNAVRCVAKYAYDHGIARKEALTVETLAGIQRVWLTVENEKVSLVKVDMGAPILYGPSIPVAIDREQVIDHPIEAEGKTFSFTGVSMGNPHAVIFVDNALDFDVEKWGSLLEKHSLFPNKANIEFVSVTSPQEVEMRVWERGCGQTFACGTGACATVVAGALTGRTNRRALVHLKGGDLEIEWAETDDHVYMIGPAEEVFTGTWCKR